MNDRMTIHELPEFWQQKVRSLKAENRNLRDRLKLAGSPGDWSQKTQKLVSESRGLRTRLRAAEERIAELEARTDA
ncbi:hypothetical protein [Prescottella sp. R16]|uniref:hypothetical protein n=1 Tax=Prescottella sp. R16 TaxID=3064529 RepID=UPI00272E4B6B|nr:hypothetical protein [Prescottella sp. R16]